jgi:hypothetical protein
MKSRAGGLLKSVKVHRFSCRQDVVPKRQTAPFQQMSVRTDILLTVANFVA